MKIKCYFAQCDISHDSENNKTTGILINVNKIGVPSLWVCEKHAKELLHHQQESDKHFRGYN